jgi:hypothetical protein
LTVWHSTPTENGVSSFSGSNLDQSVDGELQLAPSAGSGPDFGTLKGAFERTVADTQSFADQCFLNYQSRFALWNNQSSDGKKHSREGSQITPTPWDGASDLRVYEIDGAINRKVALLMMAFKKANVVASPTEGNDYKRARIVSNFMRWLVNTQIPEVDREVEKLAQSFFEKGIAATGQFWETKQEKVLVTLSMEELQGRFPDIDMLAALLDPEASKSFAAIFEEQYGCSAKKARRMIADLTKEGTTTVPSLGRRKSYPVLRTFNLDENLFIPPDTTDAENASGMYRVEYLTPEQMRGMVHTDGWDEGWVEKAIETCRGKVLNLSQSEYIQPISRSFVYQQQKFTNKVGVVYAYQRLSDEDGNPGIYCTVFNPTMGPDDTQKGYGKFSLLPYAHGQYPFVIYKRENLSARLHDTRGLPEPGIAWQAAIKAHRDSRIDAASIAIIPPIGFPMGRPPTRWGPGARIPERRPGEFHFLDRPNADPLTEQSETILVNGFKEYCGFASAEGDPQYAQFISQFEVAKFLSSLAKAFSQIYCLWNQYGDDEKFFRVVGLQQMDMSVFKKGDASEFFDFFLSFDTMSMDMEKMQIKWDALFKGFQLLDRNGNVNYTAALGAYVESIDPNLSESVLEPTEVGQERVTKEEQEDLTKIFAGFNVNAKPTTPPQLGLQIMQTYLQSPDVQQRMQTDQAFRERIEARAKQYNFAIQQQQNKLIGRQGAVMPGPVLQTQ